MSNLRSIFWGKFYWSRIFEFHNSVLIFIFEFSFLLDLVTSFCLLRIRN